MDWNTVRHNSQELGNIFPAAWRTPAVISTLLLIATFAVPLARATPSLEALSQAAAISIGDLNADGKPDLAFANVASRNVSIVLGNGDGTFGPQTDFPTGPGQPYSVAIGDLNADGRPDLAVPNFGADSVSVLLGNGDGTFAPRVSFGAGADPVCVAIGDLNADGKQDLVVANYTSSTVSVLLGNGDGTLGPETELRAVGNPFTVVIEDLNADGKPDIAVANVSSDNRVSVMLGNGDGTFAARRDFETGSLPISLAIGDLNADGKPDIATANLNSGNLSVLLGNGDGTFGAKTDIDTGLYPYFVAIGDLNGDTKPDIAVANYGPNTMSVLLGNGDGTFGPKTDSGIVSDPVAIAIGDLNVDGKPDIAAANYYSQMVSVLLGNGDGTFGDISIIVLSAQAAGGVVRLIWSAHDPENLGLALDRRTAEVDWERIATPTADASGRIAFEDSNVIPGIRYGYRLRIQDRSQHEISSEVWVLVAGDAPNVARLQPNLPNPFTANTLFSYGLPKAGKVQLSVYDLQGRRVATLVNQVQVPGWRTVSWDGRDEGGREVASGTYFARLESSGEVQVRKIVIAR